MEILDFQKITRLVCGLHWNAATPAERHELVGLVRAAGACDRSKITLHDVPGQRPAAGVRARRATPARAVSFQEH